MILLVKGEPLGGKGLTGPISPSLLLNPFPPRPAKTGPFVILLCLTSRRFNIFPCFISGVSCAIVFWTGRTLSLKTICWQQKSIQGWYQPTVYQIRTNYMYSISRGFEMPLYAGLGAQTRCKQKSEMTLINKNTK